MQFVSSPQYPNLPRTEAAVSDDCPQCGTALVDPQGLGWCQKCGFCRTLQEKPVQKVQRLTPKSGSGSSPFIRLPFWFWVLILGVGVVIGATALVDTRLPAGPKFQRALWCTVQIGVGVVLIWITQFIAVIVLAPKDASLNFMHVVLPGKIWGLVAKRLPATAPCLWAGVWSLALILSAVYFIGGLSHWNDYLPGNKKNIITVPKLR